MASNKTKGSKVTENGEREQSFDKTVLNSDCDKDLIGNIQMNPIGVIKNLSSGGTSSLNNSMNNFKETELAIIDALKDFHTGGSNPEIDRIIEEDLMKIHNDNCAKENEDSDRIVRKESQELAVIEDLSLIWFWGTFIKYGLPYLDLDYSGLISRDNLKKLWSKIPSIKLLRK